MDGFGDLERAANLRRMGATAPPVRAGQVRHAPPAPEVIVAPPPADVIDALAAATEAAALELREHVPAEPAAELGRLGVSEHLTRALPLTADRAGPRPGHPGPGQGSATVAALRSVGALPAERLLGSLEWPVGRLHPDVPEPLADRLRMLLPQQPATGTRVVSAVVLAGGEPTVLRAVALLAARWGGVAELVTALTGALARSAHGATPPLPMGRPDDETAVAGWHGATQLARAVAIGALVTRAVGLTGEAAGPPAVIALGLAAAARTLPTLPMPPRYRQARLAARRAGYRLPRSAAGTAAVTGHRFALVSGAEPGQADFSANGLVTEVDGGVAVRTGTADGAVRVRLHNLAEPPTDLDNASWDDVTEVSWSTRDGSAVVSRPPGPARRPPSRPVDDTTAPWPGDYRVRVHATGRDEADPARESYLLQVWPGPRAPQLVHKSGDLLGHRLRGEPEPPRRARPELAYRWVDSSELSMAATVTVVTGSGPAEVLRGFGARQRPEPLDELDENSGLVPWVAVLAVDDVVLAVEFNGWQGSNAPVLRAVSADGRAAGMYWNVNARYQLAFARAGELVLSFDPLLERPDTDDPEVSEALRDLDLADHRDLVAKGLLAVQRFTGRGIRPEDLTGIREAGIGYPIPD